MSPDREQGFALVLAILALTLLTAVGLSLALTTSVEVQAATNHRWSRQAFYNAEAGLELGKVFLRDASWLTILPAPRAAWLPDDPHTPPVPTFDRATRNLELGACDDWGSGAGYGAVLDDGTSDPWEHVSSAHGLPLAGAVTLWIRRPLEQQLDGRLADDVDHDVLILTAEGVAPIAKASGYARQRTARRVLEATLRRVPRGLGWDIVVESFRTGSGICRN